MRCPAIFRSLFVTVAFRAISSTVKWTILYHCSPSNWLLPASLRLLKTRHYFAQWQNRAPFVWQSAQSMIIQLVRILICFVAGEGLQWDASRSWLGSYQRFVWFVACFALRPSARDGLIETIFAVLILLFLSVLLTSLSSSLLTLFILICRWPRCSVLLSFAAYRDLRCFMSYCNVCTITGSVFISVIMKGFASLVRINQAKGYCIVSTSSLFTFALLAVASSTSGTAISSVPLRRAFINRSNW